MTKAKHRNCAIPSVWPKKQTRPSGSQVRGATCFVFDFGNLFLKKPVDRSEFETAFDNIVANRHRSRSG